MTSRLEEMERRMIRNYITLGVGMIVAAPVLWLVAPLGGIVGIGSLVLGILSVVRASTLRRPKR